MTPKGVEHLGRLVTLNTALIVMNAVTPKSVEQAFDWPTCLMRAW
ncbi:hypothetical protein FRUB_10157 [Fimbriiglobus ruber]|uniref:Uncharacterized protein n=1 Tax=Fimbriiglobus ruber TaxID=1908690 RepID=A0A225DA64_9BACT|nr:hypothetical protein FRUB_10157 [Fimbriiglobus ruber]